MSQQAARHSSAAAISQQAVIEHTPSAPTVYLWLMFVLSVAILYADCKPDA